MKHAHVEMPTRRIEGNFNQGWGVAGLIVALAVVCGVAAWYVHEHTWFEPQDYRFEAVGSLRAGAGGGH